MHTDTRMEAFRLTMEGLIMISGQLQTLAITLGRADELPSLIASTPYPGEQKRLREEQRKRGP